MGTANFGIAGLDWQQRVNWDRLKKYRTERARERMKKHGLGAMLCMYDENVRYLTGTLTPGWNRLKPGLRYALLCGDGAPVLFEQGDLGFQIERHSPWIPKENVRYSYAWIKGAAGPASQQQVKKFTDAILYEMKRHGVAGQKLGVDFIDINMINIFKDKKINWVEGRYHHARDREEMAVREGGVGLQGRRPGGGERGGPGRRRGAIRPAGDLAHLVARPPGRDQGRNDLRARDPARQALPVRRAH